MIESSSATTPIAKFTLMQYWRQNLLKLKHSSKTHSVNYYSSTHHSHASILHHLKHPKPLHQVHAQIIASNLSDNVFLCNRLMIAYASGGHADKAQNIFSRITNKNLVSWTVMVSGLTRNGLSREAIELFWEMVVGEIRPNEVTIASVLPAFGKSGVALMGKSVHCYWVRHKFKDNVFVGTGLVDMYSKLGCMNSARDMFDGMPVRNVVTWNALISGYSENGFGEEALWMFNKMRREGFSGVDIFTFMSLITASQDLVVGSEVHGLVVKTGHEHDQLIKTALMELYINLDVVNNAYSIFGEIGEKDLVCWTLMLRGFSNSGNWGRTIEHFNKMVRENGIKLDSISLVTILSGCSTSGALQQGRRVHALVIKNGFQDYVFVGSSIIDMYANCASIIEAESWFRWMEKKDVACWNALVSGYGVFGCGGKAVELFLKMDSLGMKPDESTLVSVLCACSHAGLVDQGLQIFYHMTERWNIIPNSKHYACVIDLLGRAGKINDAYSLVKRMDIQPGPEIYCSLLAACRAHRNIEVGDEISRKLLQLKPNDAGYYVLLSNMYALSGNWDRARMSRVFLKSNELKKNPGFSSIEVGGEMFTFMASQMGHPHYVEIKEFLRGLIIKIKAAGYEFDVGSVFLDVSDEVKRDILFHHSEKMAIAFGLMRTRPDSIIRITKNLRICSDCHAASKFISIVYGRVLAIKDVSRFHVFQDGLCSCGDWW